MSLLRPAVAAAFLLLVAFPGIAQQLPSAGETIEVSIINVDVFVTDKKGNRVRGLTRDDFEIRENGRLQPIANFAEYAPDAVPREPRSTSGYLGEQSTPPRNSEVPRYSEVLSVAPPAKRTIVIFVEVVPRASGRVRELFQGLRDFVRSSVRPGDAASIVAFKTRPDTRQAFTDDAQALERALVQLEKESIGVATDPHDQVQRAQESDDQAAAMLAGVTDQPVAEPASLTGLAKAAQDAFGLLDIRRKGAALTSIMESMSGIEGKKIMVVALHKFGIVPGDASGETLFKMDPRVEKVRQAVMRTANANGITLYPLFAPGVEWESRGPNPQEVRVNVMSMDSDMDAGRFGGPHAVALNNTMSLVQIAEETGGLMASGPAEIVKLLPRIADDLDTYYSLAYRVTGGGTDSRRKVVVTTKNRDYVVRSRRAVVDKSDNVQMDDRVTANLFQPLATSAIPIDVELGAITKVRRNRWSVPVAVRIPISALTPLEQDGVAAGSFSVFVGTGGRFGIMSEIDRKRQSYAIKLEDLEQARGSHFTYKVNVEFDELASAVSVGVRDDVSKEFGLARKELR